jgi:hypothetical protein
MTTYLTRAYASPDPPKVNVANWLVSLNLGGDVHFTGNLLGDFDTSHSQDSLRTLHISWLFSSNISSLSNEVAENIDAGNEETLKRGTQSVSLLSFCAG